MGATACKRTMASAGLSIFLAACRISGIHKEMDFPVSQKEQTLAIDEARKFREGFNKGACQAIYAEASEFFRHQPAQDWMSQCSELRERLGPWRNSNLKSAVRCGARPQIVCLDGAAVFDKGRYGLELAWTFRDGRPRLFWWMLQGGGQKTQLPPFPNPRNLIDRRYAPVRTSQPETVKSGQCHQA